MKEVERSVSGMKKKILVPLTAGEKAEKEKAAKQAVCRGMAGSSSSCYY